MVITEKILILLKFNYFGDVSHGNKVAKLYNSPNFEPKNDLCSYMLKVIDEEVYWFVSNKKVFKINNLSELNSLHHLHTDDKLTVIENG